MPAICSAMMKGECVANPATGRCFWCDREVKADPRIVAVRRIKAALHAEADRAAGIDTSKRRPRIASLPGLRAQLRSRDALPMRVVADILDEADPMRELLARVQAIVEKAEGVDFTEAGEHEHAAAVIDAIRQTLADDVVDVQPWVNPVRGTRGWAGSDIPDGPPACPTCGKAMQRMTVMSHTRGLHNAGDICLDCHPFGKLFKREGD
jgi:hypothetical protein